MSESLESTPQTVCSVAGCSRPRKKTDRKFGPLCTTHYSRARVHGDPEHTKMPTKGMSVRERFEYYLTEPNNNGCREWSGPVFNSGYGSLNTPEGNISASKYAYTYWNDEEIPTGYVVRHTCDNPPCVAKKHLVLGTVQDNVDDRVTRGRSYKAYGDSHFNTKISDSKVREIFELRAQGWTHQKIADHIGTARRYVGKILSGEKRAHGIS